MIYIRPLLQEIRESLIFFFVFFVSLCEKFPNLG